MSWTAARHHKGLDALLAGARHGSTSKRCVRWSSPALFVGRARRASASRCRDRWAGGSRSARVSTRSSLALVTARPASVAFGGRAQPCSVVEPGGASSGQPVHHKGLDAFLAGARHGSTDERCVRWSSGLVRWSSPASVSESVSRPGDVPVAPPGGGVWGFGLRARRMVGSGVWSGWCRGGRGGSAARWVIARGRWSGRGGRRSRWCGSWRGGGCGTGVRCCRCTCPRPGRVATTWSMSQDRAGLVHQGNTQ